MPELPEVETIKRSLQKQIVGKTIKSIEVRKQKLFKGDPKDVIGKKISSVKRAGKMLLFDLEGELSLLVHLKMSGQLIWSDSLEDNIIFGNPIPFAGGNTLPGRTTHIIIKTDSGTLFYNDLRQFGWIKVVQSSKFKVLAPSKSSVEEQSELANLGPEPFEGRFTADYLKKIFTKTSKPIKIVIMEQEKITGIGNIYANDALFEAGILPTRPAKSLSGEDIKILRDSILRVLEDGIKYGGSSAGDEAYVHPDGSKGNYQDHARVYQKDGEKCPRCGGIIKRIKLGGRGTFYCPVCQH